ncbi:MAG TPA: neutral zinc metallopeptidase, partial [Stellaceae bacterium]|nr:neutral zinc metallopeptidase [Stellaceae bacterium]
MRWSDFRRSDNIEDRRSQGGMGAGGGYPIRGGHLGLGSIIVLLLISWVFGINPLALLGGAEILTNGDQYDQAPYAGAPGGGPATTGAP